MSVTVVKPSESTKKSILDLLQVHANTLTLAEGVELPFFPLTLLDLVTLFAGYQEAFLSLYATAVDARAGTVDYGAVMMAAPDMVAKVIATALHRPEEEEDIRNNVSATWQLIALEAIFKASVPDPKKLGELLSTVTGLLRKLSNKGKELTQQSSSPATSPSA